MELRLQSDRLDALTSAAGVPKQQGPGTEFGGTNPLKEQFTLWEVCSFVFFVRVRSSCV